jgi:hypothetical protein
VVAEVNTTIPDPEYLGIVIPNVTGIVPVAYCALVNPNTKSDKDADAPEYIP